MSNFVNTVDLIGDEALTNSIIDGSITEIKDNILTKLRKYAFYRCSSLTTANLPLVTGEAKYPFYRCSSLTDVNLPLVTSLNCTFRECSKLASIDLPSVTSIGSQAFYRCTVLKTVILRSEAMVTLTGKDVFTGTPIASGKGYIYVPRALLSDDDETKDYRRATNWSTYASQFRAIEDYPAICSPIGKVWKNSNVSDVRFSCVKHINGLWVACGSAGIYTSTDGKNWTKVIARSLENIVFFNGVWCGSDSTNTLRYSTDLITWQESNITTQAAYAIFHCAGGILFATNSKGTWTSTDGMTWTKENRFSDCSGSIIEYHDGVWVRTLDMYGLYYSTDGTTWTKVDGISYDDANLVYNEGIWVTATESGIYTSTDGITWTLVNSTFNRGEYLTYANGLWFATDYNGLHYSSDLTNWNLIPSSGLIRNSTVQYHDGLWVAEGIGLYYSTDGTTWIQSNLTSGYLEIDYADGVWVAVGTTNSKKGIYYSDVLE